MLFVRTGCPHGIRLAGPGLTIRQNRDIVTLEKRGNTIAQVIPHAILVDGFGEDTIEDEEFAALRDVDGEVRGRRDVDH